MGIGTNYALRPRLRRVGPSLALVGLSAFLAFVQLRLMLLVLADGFAQSREAAHAVTIGQPHWRVFQNRVLGPYVVEWLGSLVGLETAYTCFVLLSLTAAGVLAYRLGRKVAGRLGGALAFTVFQLGFAAMLCPPWLYAWDFLDVIAFLVFTEFVISKRSWRWFVGLFAVAILNRESAQFIALWLVADPLARYALARYQQRDGARLELASLAAGVCCLIAGSITVSALRAYLLVEEVGPRLWGITPPSGYVSFAIKRSLLNLEWLRRSFSAEEAPHLLAIPLIIGFTTWLAISVAVRGPVELLGLSVVNLAMIAALLLLGNLPESRIYLDLLPYLCLACVVTAAGPTARFEPGIGERAVSARGPEREAP